MKTFDMRQYSARRLHNIRVSEAINSNLYHVIVIRKDNGNKTYITKSPVTHTQGCTILSKMTKHSFRFEQLEEVTK